LVVFSLFSGFSCLFFSFPLSFILYTFFLLSLLSKKREKKRKAKEK